MKKQNLIFLMLCAITSSELVSRAMVQPRSQDPSLKTQNNALRNQMKSMPQRKAAPLANKKAASKSNAFSKKNEKVVNKRDEWKKIGEKGLLAAQNRPDALINMIDSQFHAFYLLSQQFLSSTKEFNHKSMDNLNYNLKSLQTILNVEMKNTMESGDSVQTAERMRVRVNNLTKVLQDYKIYKSAKGTFFSFKSSDTKYRAKLNSRTKKLAQRFNRETDYLNVAKQGKKNAKKTEKVMSSNKAKRSKELKKVNKAKKANSVSLNSSSSVKSSVQSAPIKNAEGKAPVQGAARKKTAGKAPVQGAARKKTAKGAPRKNAAGKAPVQGAARKNVARKAPVKGAARKNAAEKAAVSAKK